MKISKILKNKKNSDKERKYIVYKKFRKTHSKQLIDFLRSQKWKHHIIKKEDKKSIKKRIDNGYYSNSGVETYWIILKNKKIGFIKIFDLENKDDSSPLFDIRIDSSERGKGIGLEATKFAIKYIFKEYNKIRRIEATTREDNIPMQKVLKKCGFKREAIYRKAWKISEKKFVDSYGYAILRKDIRKLK
jgi:RimJ/RimL family protein N-acetyltransferase